MMKRRLRTSDRAELQGPGSGTETEKDDGGITIQETGRSQEWLVKQFVRRIGQPETRAMYIGPYNQNGGWAPVADAIRSGRSFCITLRHDVVALDADGEESGRAVEQELVPYLRDSGLRPVLMRSGRAFHRHLFVRVADPQKRERMIAWARSRRIDVRNPSPIRPFAPHRLGLRVALLHPNTVEAALEALAPSPNRHRVSLSGRMFALLRYGDRDGRYRSRCEVVQALAQAAVNAGFPESWLLRVLLDPKNLGGQKVAEIAARNGENAARRYVTLSYRKALQRAAHSPAFRNGSDALTAISEIALAADAWHFLGRGGPTALAVLHAHIAIARRVRGVRYGASVRELAEIAGLSSIATVSAANRRLEQAGFLVHLDKSWGGGSTRYLLKLPRSVTNPNNHTSGGMRSIVRVGYDPG